MNRGSARRAAAAAFLALPLLLGAGGSSEVAERQYRVARRLAAERAEGALDALQRVVELDPAGPFADDALVDAAILLGSRAWPEQTGGIETEQIQRALDLLDRVIDSVPGADRAGEARLRRALLRLEPSPLRNPTRARLDLIAAASGAGASPWALAARYAAAHLDDETGDIEAARGGYTRLLVDHPGSEAASRAKTALARILLREGRPGIAAALLEEAVRDGAPEEVGATALRELAVRAVLRAAARDGRGGLGKPVALGVALPGARAIAAHPSGDLLVADAKAGRVVRLGADGQTVETWATGEVQALAVDRWGRLFAAAGDKLHRLREGGGVSSVAALGPFARPSALAPGPAGLLYAADRRGERIGVLRPGASGPETVVARTGTEVSGLAWDGRRLLAALPREGSIAEVSGDILRPLPGPTLRRPDRLAADAAGELAVLDSRSGELLRLGPDGQVRDRIRLADIGLERSQCVAVGPTGEIALLEPSTGRMVVVP